MDQNALLISRAINHRQSLVLTLISSVRGKGCLSSTINLFNPVKSAHNLFLIPSLSLYTSVIGAARGLVEFSIKSFSNNSYI